MNNDRAKSQLTEISPSRRELKLEIPETEVQNEYGKILNAYISRVKISGFRKGHAPPDMVRKLFDSEIRHDVYDSLVPRVLGEELKALNVNPVNVPVIKDLKQEDGQPLNCLVVFEVIPDFELPDYRDIKVDRPKTEVAEEEIENTLAELRERATEYVPVEGRSVKDGDYVVAEIQGKDLKTKKLLPAEKIVVLAGHADNEPALNDNVMGARAGEERTFQVTYPKDHPSKRLAGKDIGYRLKVRDIKEKRLPELDDDFAKSVGDHQTLNDLREKIRTELKSSKEGSARSEMAAEVLRQIGRSLSLELPQGPVEHEAQGILRRLLGAYRQPSRISAEALDQLKKQARLQAEERLTNHLILEKIAANEGLEVSEGEVQEEIKILAKANNVSLAALMDMINRENRREEIRENLLFRKTVDFLVKSAIIS